MPDVSVIIPTWNRSTVLLNAVNSALQQTVPVYEILVCDDGSDDDSAALIQHLNNPKVKWLNCGRNGMPSVPRNKGIMAAQGDYIAFLDSDDTWLPEKTEKQLQEMVQKKISASCTNAFQIINSQVKGTYFEARTRNITFEDLVALNLNICSSVMVDKNLLVSTSLFPEEKKYKAIEDYALWLRIATRSDFAFVGEPLVNYNDEPTGSVRNNYTDVWQLREVIFNGLDEWLKEKNLKQDAASQHLLQKNRKLIENKGKSSLIDRIKNKIR